ncbi:GDP-mannose 4,6-dehydratase [Gracilibacillus sp. Marseille-QA3620]
MSYKQPDPHKVYLVTGAAGFVGYYLSHNLLEKGCRVVGIDNMNDYYDVRLKEKRLELLSGYERFTFLKVDISDKRAVEAVFEKYQPEIVVNLAAQAGVRYSITNPDAYILSNVIGFYNILECCRHSYDEGNTPVEHLLYASSSSVYGSNKKTPYSVEDKTDDPVSLYAATKKGNELLARSYSNLYNIPATGLRFFTVYGPMGRPDMAYYGFTQKIFAGEPIKIFNHGDMKRDFTYVDDIVGSMERMLNQPPPADEHGVPHKVYNIGNSSPEPLMYFIETLEKALSKAAGSEIVAKKEFLPMQPGDVYATFADTEPLEKAFGFKPSTSIGDGLQRFADWYCEYYDVK